MKQIKEEEELKPCTFQPNLKSTKYKGKNINYLLKESSQDTTKKLSKSYLRIVQSEKIKEKITRFQ